jgi:hypothetical protein
VGRGLPFAGPATSATGAVTGPKSLMLSRALAAAADEGTGDADGRPPGPRGEMPHRVGGASGSGAPPQIRRRGEKRKRASVIDQLLESEGSGSVSGGSQSG